MNRFVFHSTLIVVSWLLAGCSALLSPDKEPPTRHVSGDEYPVAVAQDLIKKGALILDVRTPEEFARGHLSGAVNIPHTQVQTRIASVMPDKSRPIVTYCQSGRRAEVAQEDLREMGYTNVTNGGSISGLR